MFDYDSYQFAGHYIMYFLNFFSYGDSPIMK